MGPFRRSSSVKALVSQASQAMNNLCSAALDQDVCATVSSATDAGAKPSHVRKSSSMKSLVAQAVSNLYDEVQDLKFQFSEFRAELVNMRSAVRDNPIKSNGSQVKSSDADVAVRKLSDEICELKRQITELHADRVNLLSAPGDLNSSKGSHAHTSAADTPVSKLSNEMWELKAQFREFCAEQTSLSIAVSNLTCSGGIVANQKSCSGSVEELGTAKAAKQQLHQLRQHSPIIDVDRSVHKASSVLAELKDWMNTLNTLHAELAKDNWSAKTQSLKAASASTPRGWEGQHLHGASQQNSPWSVGQSYWPTTSNPSTARSNLPRLIDELLSPRSTQAGRIQQLENFVFEGGNQSTNSRPPGVVFGNL